MLRNRTHLFFLLCLFYLMNGVSAQVVKPVSEIPESLKKQANAVVQYERMHVLVTSPSQSVTEEVFAVTILNDKADRLAIMHKGFDKSFHNKPEISGEVYDARGKMIKKSKKKDLLERSAIDNSTMYADDRILYLDLRQNDYPYTVLFKIKQSHKDMGILPRGWSLYPGEKVSIMQAELQVEAPQAFGIKYKAHKIEEGPKIGRNQGKKTYTWSFRNQTPYENEHNAPNSNNPFILLVPESFVAGSHKGSHANWEALGKFYYELNEGRDELPEEMKQKVHSLTAEIQEPRGKVDKLYKYLQESTRYVSVQLGIGGWQTFDAAYVYKNGYGDCKALSNYMKSMLKELGIPSHVGAIYRDRNPPPFYADFPISQFNHVILCVPMKEDTVWLECTNSFSPPGYLDQSTVDRHILLYTPDGGKLVKTPASMPAENEQIRVATIALDKEGNAQVDMAVHYSGYQQDVIREGIMQLSKDDQKKWLRRRIDLGSYEITRFEMKDVPEQNRPTIRVETNLSSRNLGSLSGNRLFLPLRSVESPLSVPKADKNRSQEFELSYPYLDTDTLVYHIPEGFHIEGMPEVPVEVKESFGEYRINIEQLDSNTLRYTRSMKMEKQIVPANRYEDLRNFFKKINKLDRIQVVLANKS